ncbi:MAG: methyltransferase domain-containing protein [Pseudomonadota bacterium]
MQLAGLGQLPIGELFTIAQELIGAGQAAAGIALYRHWLAHTVSPLAYAVCFNLAVSLANEGDDSGAEQLYRQAIELNPGFVEARLNLGTLQERCGRPDEALATWQATLDQVADLPARPALHLQTLNNLGRLLEVRKQFAAAEAMLVHSLEVEPDQPNVLTHYVHLRQKQCEWPVYQPLDRVAPEAMLRATSALAMLSASDDPALQLAAARRFVDDKVITDVPHLTGAHGYGHRRLRIGYLSSDFCSHAVSILTAELYELHDRSKVEVYAFSWSREDHSPIRARVVKAMDHYLPIAALSDEKAARLIRSHEIDILIDLHGLTLNARPGILSWRPAPVQMTYLGFPGTTALPQIDYVLADAFLLPPEVAAHFTEKPLYLHDTFQINDRQRAIGPRPSRASCALPDQAFVFCSFNNNFKFTPEVFAIWMRILGRVPGSVLWLVADNELVRENLWRSAEQAGVARARLIFASRAVPAEYLARYQLADLFLDTFPFNAGTTASDALWAGLPLLTCVGATFASRMAGSLLRAVDLPELITFNFADYEERAVALAADPERIAAMKRQLDSNRLSCALFDSPRFVRNLETVLRQVAKGPAPARLAAHPTQPSPNSAHAVESGPAMLIEQISIVTVSYNAPDLIDTLLASLRRFYNNRIYVIDGSRPELATDIGRIAATYPDVDFIPFGYNIHHGPGMAWAINNLTLSGQVLFIDSDVEILKPGFLESLAGQLAAPMYGVGNVLQVNEQGQPVAEGGIPYLHPACMLCNIEVVRRWPLPIKHGAPMITPMLALHESGASALIGNIDWVSNDFGKNPDRIFIKHDWQGTVIRTGGYHYDQPAASTAHDALLLSFVPLTARKVVELGCRDGAFAKAYKARNPICDYTGVERDPAAADLARSHCDFVYAQEPDRPDAQRAHHTAGADCWVLGDVLGQLADPWALLAAIRASIAPGGTVVASVKNFQHWASQLRLSVGDLRYQDGGPLARADLRQFTRGTMLELFQRSGWRVTGGAPVIVDEPGRDAVLPLLRQLAEASGNDPVVSLQDALPQRYIITAVAA